MSRALRWGDEPVEEPCGERVGDGEVRHQAHHQEAPVETIPCPRCGGVGQTTGEEHWDGPLASGTGPCPSCNGAGHQVTNSDQSSPHEEITCPACGGEGQTVVEHWDAGVIHPCRVCHRLSRVVVATEWPSDAQFFVTSEGKLGVAVSNRTDATAIRVLSWCPDHVVRDLVANFLEMEEADPRNSNV